MNAILWATVPLAPLVAISMLMLRRGHLAYWIWLAGIPAVTYSLWPASPVAIDFLWPGANWGATDTLSRALLGFTGLLWSAASLFGASSQQGGPSATRFWLFWLLALSGNLLLLIARDGISFYVGFSLMSLAAYGLVAHLPGRAPRQGGRSYLQWAILGEMLLYAGLMMRLHETNGALQFAAWRDIAIEPLTAVLLMAGLGLKAGFWPLHYWLPRAHPVAPAAASAVLSGAMLKAGILGLWQFFPDSDPLLANGSATLIALGLFSAFYGALVGLVHTKAKVVLAYSSVSQMGYLLAIVALAWHQPEHRDAWGLMLALYAVHHGLAKGALFLGAGVAADRPLTQPLWWMLTLPALALAALPLTSGAAVKTELKTLLAATDFQQWGGLFTLGSLATALLIMRALWLLRPRSSQRGSVASQPRAQLLACSLLCLAAPVAPWLWPAMRDPLLYSLKPENLVALLWPIGLAVVLSLGATKVGLTLPLGDSKARGSIQRVLLKLRYVWKAPPEEPVKSSSVRRQRWRSRERHWNRFWQRRAVTQSVWLLVGLLVLGWLW